MVYEQQTQYDIFVSYRHASDSEVDVQWVTKFSEYLKLKIKELLGDEVRIFLDKAELRAGDQWRPEIESALESAAIFLAIISRTYFHSNVCREEMDRFLGLYKQANDGKPRLIFPIFKQPPPPELPPEVNEIHRPRNFYRDNPPGFDEFVPGRKTDSDYWDALGKVAQELNVQLEKIRECMRPPTIGNVYLGEVGRELQRERDNLQAELFQRRYGVLPANCYMWNAANIGDKIEADLNEADLTVHLIGRSSPSRPETPARTREQIDRAVAATRRNGKPAPLVWIQSGAGPEVGVLRDLIDYVKTELPEKGVEFFEGSLEDFKSHVVSKLPQGPTAAQVSVDAGYVALLVDSKDLVAAKALKLELVERLGCEPQSIRVSESGVVGTISAMNVLNRCGHCIIFWGDQPESWVNEVLALDGLARYQGRERLCVYVAAPDSDEKQSFVTRRACTIHETSADGTQAQLRVFLGATHAP